MNQSSFGSCIRALRIQNKMTQAQLAKKIGVTDKAVSKWERDLSYPDIALFPKLADVLGTSVNDLLSGSADNCRPSRLLQVFKMSRDIRTPLHIMLGFVEIAKSNRDDPEALEQYLEGIRVSGEYLMTLLNEITRTTCCGSAPDSNYPLSQENLEKYLRERISSAGKDTRTYDFAGRRILIVEDMAINREIAAEILKSTGALPEFAENGRVCLEKIILAPDRYYDLVLMDILMPEMDGLEATRRIRSLPDKEKSGIPIIAMTTNVEEKDRNAAFEAGMDAFIEKPFFVDKLFSVMKQYLRQS